MTKRFAALVIGAMLLSGGAWAQQMRLLNSAYAAPDSAPSGLEAPSREDVSPPRLPVLPLVPVRPRMSADLALATYERHAAEQGSMLAAYSDTTVINAELPDTRQRGEFELKRTYAAPKTLKFTPVRFLGDNFVKTNVIVRVLQSESDHVNRQQGPETAVNEDNYKFSFKSSEDLDGRSMYVYHVKPRQKRLGLFKGRIFIDPFTGNLRRAEGAMVKSPSWFVKKVEFVQDYVDVGAFTLPQRLHSEAKARIIGRTVVDIIHRDYQAQAAGSDTTPGGGGESTLSANSN